MRWERIRKLMIQIVGCKKQNIFMVRDINCEGKSKRKKNNKKH